MPSYKPNYKLAEAKAIELLRVNSVIDPPIPVEQIAENCGLRVYTAEFEGYSDVAGYIDLDSNRIVVSNADSERRRAFTVAHEVGHYVMHRERLVQDPDISILYRRAIDGAKDPIEQEANCFAANLLVPKHFLVDYQDLALSKIATIFGVSEEVIGYRLKALNWS